jgi:hypothetical protein
MPRGMRYGIYVADDGTTQYARLVDADEITQAARGWSTSGVAGLPLLPIRSKPRVVYGVSATSGRRGSAVVATTAADLWTGVATTFTVEANDGTSDTMTVTRRRGESFAQAH